MKSDIQIWKEHWQDESDAAYLYDQLANLESDPNKSDLYRRLAEVEKRHVQLCEKMLQERGTAIKRFRPSLRTRVLSWLGRQFGPDFLTSFLFAEEGRELRTYLKAYRHSSPQSDSTFLQLARESAEHTQALGSLIGRSEEPWHRTKAGGYLGNIVYGFNDGLTANFGLIMGVIGAQVPTPVILISGIAGLIADAFSMGSSGYLAAKSEAEVYRHEVAMEREEIRVMPELETEELTILYQMKGMNADEAKQRAEQIMKNPESALEEQTREELGIAPQTVTPIREGLITGIATGFGAFIPLIPFFFLSKTGAIWGSLTISMLSHFGVGAARSFFTGRSIFKSGMDMFLIGLGVAIVGYLVGRFITDYL